MRIQVLTLEWESLGSRLAESPLHGAFPSIHVGQL